MADGAAALRPDASGWRRRLPQAALFFLPFLLYARSLNYGLLGIDDDVYFQANEALHGGALSGLPGCLGWFYSELTPVTQFTIWLDFALFGQHAWWGPRMQQLLWFGLCTLGLQAAMLRLTGRPRLALAVAFLFAVHPVCVTTPVWLANRKTVVALALCLWSLERYLAYRTAPEGPERRRAYAAALLLAGLGWLSKIHAVALPLLLLAAEYTLARVTWRQRVLACAPFAVLAGAFLCYSVFSPMRSSLNQEPFGGSTLAAASDGGLQLLRYFRLAAVPYPLSFYYGLEEPLAANPLAWLAWAAVLGVPLLAAWRWPACRLMAGAWLLGCAGLFPALNFVAQPVHMADHYMLWALPGWLLCLALAAENLLKTLRRPNAVPWLAGAWLAALALLTALRVPEFAVPVEYFRLNASREPRAALAWINYAFSLASQRGADNTAEIERAGEMALGSPDASRLLPAQRAFALKKAIPAMLHAGRRAEAQALLSHTLDGYPHAKHPYIVAALAEIRARTGDAAGALELASHLRPVGLDAALQEVRRLCRDGQRLPDEFEALFVPAPDSAGRADGFDRRSISRMTQDVLRITAAARVQQQQWEEAFDAAALLVNLAPEDAGASLLLAGICSRLNLATAAERLRADRP